MENMQEHKELTQREQEQVIGGIDYGYGYYCNNVCCSKHAIIVSPTVDNNCHACGGPLTYGKLPKTIDV